MPGNVCWVPNCTSGISDKKGGHYGAGLAFFRPPKDAVHRQEWNKAIPRQDGELLDSSRVCELHFLPSEVVKNKVIEYGTHSETKPLRYPVIARTAIPSQFPSKFICFLL